MVGLVGSVLVGVYLSFLVLFGFVTHPLVYCLLLVGGSLCLSLATILYWGFSWYLVLFILVYVGGVYVLFLFISVHSANSYPVLSLSPSFVSIFFLLFLFFFYFLFRHPLFLEDNSYYLCSYMEGFSYLILCFSLLVGFIGVSIVSSQKDSFFR